MNKHICEGCQERSVEPSCRAACPKWQEHEAAKAARYERKQKEIADTYVNHAKEKYVRRNLLKKRG